MRVGCGLSILNLVRISCCLKPRTHVMICTSVSILSIYFYFFLVHIGCTYLPFMKQQRRGNGTNIH
jgi:hypothetical protein